MLAAYVRGEEATKSVHGRSPWQLSHLPIDN